METLIVESADLFSLYLKERDLLDLELLLNGGFSPLEGYLSQDRERECELLLGTTDKNHPYANWLLKQPDLYYVRGTLQKISLPIHYDFPDLRYTPQEMKDFFRKNEWKTIVGFQTRNPLHRAHIELIRRGNEGGRQRSLCLVASRNGTSSTRGY